MSNQFAETRPTRFEGWSARQRLAPENRRQVLQTVTIRANARWPVRFGIMFALAGRWRGDPLTTEVLARTSPDTRDLVVAFAAPLTTEPRP